MPNDNIYNVILTHRLPISRNEKPIQEFMEEYFSDYIKSLQLALTKPYHSILRDECYEQIQKKLPIIKELCEDIITVFQYYDNAKMQNLYYHFDTMMQKIESYIKVEDVRKTGHVKYKYFYRIRSGDSELSRLDMFHIPMNNRKLIRSYRYSIPGYPCLYLATGLELCWFECGMPKNFSYSSFWLDLKEEESVKLIDFTLQPLELVFGVQNQYQNHPENSNMLDKFLVNYLITFPLRAACSLEVINKDSAFVQEYIIPQHLLLWIREHNNFDGIAYRTASAIEKAKEWNYFNVVLPAKELENGYCKKLSQLFKVTQPVNVKIRNIIEKRYDDIEKVRDFARQLENQYSNGYILYPYREILSICKTFLLLCNSLSSDGYKNAEIIYQAMDNLNLMTDMISENNESIRRKALEKGKSLYTDINPDLLASEYDMIMKKYNDNVRPVLFEFWSYVIRISSNAGIDDKTYERVL